MSGIQTNRSNISLPTEVASEIIQKTQETSAVSEELSAQATTLEEMISKFRLKEE